MIRHVHIEEFEKVIQNQITIVIIKINNICQRRDVKHVLLHTLSKAHEILYEILLVRYLPMILEMIYYLFVGIILN